MTNDEIRQLANKLCEGIRSGHPARALSSEEKRTLMSAVGNKVLLNAAFVTGYESKWPELLEKLPEMVSDAGLQAEEARKAEEKKGGKAAPMAPTAAADPKPSSTPDMAEACNNRLRTAQGAVSAMGSLVGLPGSWCVTQPDRVIKALQDRVQEAAIDLAAAMGVRGGGNLSPVVANSLTDLVKKIGSAQLLANAESDLHAALANGDPQGIESAESTVRRCSVELGTSEVSAERVKTEFRSAVSRAFVEISANRGIDPVLQTPEVSAASTAKGAARFAESIRVQGCEE